MANHPIVGAWMVTTPSGPALAVFSADGTNIQGVPTAQAGPQGVTFTGAQVGTWEADGDRRIHFTGVQLHTDATGAFAGTVTIDGHPRVSEDGQTIIDDAPETTVTIRDAANTVVNVITPTPAARRRRGSGWAWARPASRRRRPRRYADLVESTPADCERRAGSCPAAVPCPRRGATLGRALTSSSVVKTSSRRDGTPISGSGMMDAGRRLVTDDGARVATTTHRKSGTVGAIDMVDGPKYVAVRFVRRSLRLDPVDKGR